MSLYDKRSIISLLKGYIQFGLNQLLSFYYISVIILRAGHMNMIDPVVYLKPELGSGGAGGTLSSLVGFPGCPYSDRSLLPNFIFQHILYALASLVS